jgi:hypothetical protein
MDENPMNCTMTVAVQFKRIETVSRAIQNSLNTALLFRRANNCGFQTS